MSVSSARSQLERKQKDLAKLQADKSRIIQKQAAEAKKENDARKAIARTSSASTIRTKERVIASAIDSQAKLQKELSTIEGKITRATTAVNSAKAHLDKEELAEAKKRQKALDTANKETERRMANLQTGLDASIRNQSELADRVRNLEDLPEEITVLFMAACPKNVDRIRLDEEAREIHDSLRKTDYRDNIKLETRWALRPIDVLNAINETKPTIIHFSGHGANDGSLVLEDGNGEAKMVNAGAMASAIATASDGVKLIIFNACYSDSQALEASDYVPASIGMSDTVSDNGAVLFSAQLYSAIGYGKSVGLAFRQARALLKMEGSSDADIVTLHVSDDFDADELVIVKPSD